ncbi:MAG TPA: dienelactone hydrolase family protein [Candidatus Limnocylindrales bacterium]|nr:dienelactone hydrolase family protein [Candidatus Limnocylindrales bacterium]
MMRPLAFGLAFAALFTLAFPSAPARAGMVSFTQGSAKVNGYLETPEGEGTHPAIIAVHEWWGLNDWVKEQAEQLRKQGYVVLAVDLYDGKVAKDQETAHQLMSGLDEAAAIAKLRAAADFLRGRSDVRSNAIGVIGWCMGGGYAIGLAAADPGIRAVVMYYGAPLTEERAIRGLQASVLGNFGAEDKGITPEKVRTFEKALRRAGKRVDFKIYPGAGHAFANVNNPWGGYREAAAKDAWLRTVAFLRRELKQASLPRHRSMR